MAISAPSIVNMFFPLDYSNNVATLAPNNISAAIKIISFSKYWHGIAIAANTTTTFFFWYRPWIGITIKTTSTFSTITTRNAASTLSHHWSATTKQYDPPGAGLGNGITEGTLQFVLHESTSYYNSVQSCCRIWISSFHQFDILGYSSCFRFSPHFTHYRQKAPYASKMFEKIAFFRTATTFFFFFFFYCNRDCPA